MNDRSGRERPSLPQSDSPEDQECRLRDVAAARKTYTWTTQVPTLPGTPLAAAVPREDKPDVPWLIATAKVAIPVLENVLENKLAAEQADVGGHRARLGKIKASVAQIEVFHDDQRPGGLKGLFEAAVGAVDSVLGTHGDTLNGHLDELAAILEANTLGPRAAADLDAYRDQFKKLPLPAVADTFADDETFARMRVAGPNAAMIEGVAVLPAKFPLTDAEYLAGMRLAAGADSLARAGAEGRLFVVDYAALASMVPGTSGGRQKYLSCPVACFAVAPGGRSIQAVAIQCGQDPAASPVHVRPAAGTKVWAWEMAKFVVQVADGNYHELFAHLARTHLVQEVFAVATHRALAPSHPLYLLLIGHTEGTLFINNSAAGGLIAAGGPIEKIFAGTIETIQLAAVHDRLAFDFTARMLPNDLNSRRVSDRAALPDYPYRDDALLVWGALQRWIDAYVRTYYRTDDDVVGDTELAAFGAEVRGLGKVKGFPVIESIAGLVQALTMIVFNGSAQHAAVNFPQQTDMTWVPNVTGSAWAPGPDAPGPKDEAAWLAMLPTTDLALQQINTLWVLGGVHFRKLGDYRCAELPYGPWFLDPQITRDGGPLEVFRNDLGEVRAQIERNNRERSVPYPFLSPENIPESINI